MSWRGAAAAIGLRMLTVLVPHFLVAVLGGGAAVGPVADACITNFGLGQPRPSYATQQRGGAMAAVCRAVHEQHRRARLTLGEGPLSACAWSCALMPVSLRACGLHSCAEPNMRQLQPSAFYHAPMTGLPPTTQHPACCALPAALEDIRRYFHRDFSLLQYNSSIPWADSGIDGGIVLGDGAGSLAVLGSSTSSLADASGVGLGSGGIGGGDRQHSRASGVDAAGGGGSTGQQADPAAADGFPDPREMAMKG